MKLSKVIIENYRGFYGKNVIEFDTGKNGKNISLVIARNDTGKTTLLNAIYWCLYGEEQFYSSKNSNKRILSNKKIIETSIDGKMKIVVTLVFNDNKGPKYEITRERIFRRAFDDDNDLKIIQQGEDIFHGVEMNSAGTGFENMEYINNFVEKNIPKGISYLFLLDGEQLKAIFTSDINYKIKEAIERVAKMDSINGMIENLINLDKKYSRDKSGLDSNFGVIQTKIDDCDKKLDEKNNSYKNIMRDNEKLKKQLLELADFLQNHNEVIIREYGANEKRLRNENELISEQKKSDEIDLNKLVVDAYILKNSNQALTITLKKFDEIIASGDFPPAFDPAHVLQLLKRGECICGNKVLENSEEEKRLKKLVNAQSYKEYVRIIAEGGSRLPEMVSVDEKINKISKLRKKINDNELRLQKNAKEIEDITQKLKDSNVDEIKEKAEEKEMIERAIYKNEREISGLDRDIADLTELKKYFENELTKIKIRGMKDQLIVKKSEKCRELINYAKRIKEIIMKKIKDKIEESTAQNFIDLHWKATNYEKVSISDDFSLSIKDKYKGEIINELSQGAALCFGLAFMSALRNYSGYDVPIIIDSPVGKIDEGNREKIANNLPNQLEGRQVIFLVTSSEYTSVFKEALENKIATKINLDYNNKTGEIDIKNGSN